MQPEDLLKIIEFNQYSFGDVLSYIILYLAILWLLFSLWAMKDISSRTTNPVAIVTVFFMVLIFNFPALMIYLLLRPESTLEESRALDVYRISQLDSQLTTCSNCTNIIRNEYDHCTVCGSSLATSCFSCEKRINPIWTNCAHCGIRLADTNSDLIAQKFAKLRLTMDLMVIRFSHLVSDLRLIITGTVQSVAQVTARLIATIRLKKDISRELLSQGLNNTRNFKLVEVKLDSVKPQNAISNSKQG